MHHLHRRQFHQAVLTGLAVPTICTSAVRGDDAPSRKIQLGFIGVGVMGRGHLGSFLREKDVRVVAVSDVVAERRDDARRTVNEHYTKEKKGTAADCVAYNDFRELLARKDIDAVVIATPDHWHAIPCVLAAEAKKDIYCEKPLTHVIAHGRKVVEAARRNKVIFQTGSQQRSEFGGKFHQAAEYVRNGRIGKVKTIRIGVGGPAVACDLKGDKTPEGIDWNLWLGPAPQREFSEVLCPIGIHKHFPAWRNYREYAGGGLADMGAHHFDIAQWALGMDDTGPVLIEPPEKGNSGCKFTYANGVVMFHGGPSGCTFEGSDGTIYVDRGKLEASNEKLFETPLTDKDKRLYRATNHRKNWLESIRSRKAPICPAEVGHRTATICNLGNIAYWLRRKLRWDPKKEQFVDDAEANKLVDREMRAPWKL
ncbi:MAG: Gfo/Idh/MocA family oxidoreductase [Gemmataceae bacterium]